MARAMKCTRCGTYYDDYSTELSCLSNSKEKWPYNAVLTVDKGFDEMLYQRDLIDLCPNCKKSFENWMKEAQP